MRRKFISLAATAAVGAAVVLAVSPAGVSALPASRPVTVKQYGAVAKLPAGWRQCRYGLQHASRCSTRYQSHATGGFSVRPWSSRYRGDTCLAQNFTNGGPGPRIRVPSAITRSWQRRGWHKPTANRTVVVDQSSRHQNQLLYILCARTADRRVVEIDFIGRKSQGSAVLTKALWSVGRTIHPTGQAVYLPGGYPKKIKPGTAIWAGDGTDELSGLQWSSWSHSSARGHGTEQLDNCVPGCADGHESYYPVKLHARDPQYLRCGMFFSKVDVRYTHRVPRHSKRTWTFVVSPKYNAQELYTIGPCRS